VESARASWNILKSFNLTFIIVILKDYDENMIDKHYLISLCNVIYYVIDKIIANHLNPIMSKLTSQEQGGVCGRKTYK
jgi:hypothetical protein